MPEASEHPGDFLKLLSWIDVKCWESNSRGAGGGCQGRIGS